MGMIANLLRVNENELEKYLKDSSLLENDIYNEDSASKSLQLADIDKSWDGIIFLLTGKSFQDNDDSLMRVLFSGQLIDEEQDMGVGPAHYLTPNEVKEIYSQISTVRVEDLKEKYNPIKMDELEVYPNIWKRDDDYGFDYLSRYFLDVQRIYAEASQNNEAIITFLN